MNMFEDRYNLGGNINGGDEGLGHDINMLTLKMNELGSSVQKYDVYGAYGLSAWATTIRHNSNTKTNCELIKNLNKKTIDWIREYIAID